jgi:hypothetical protein
MCSNPRYLFIIIITYCFYYSVTLLRCLDTYTVTLLRCLGYLFVLVHVLQLCDVLGVFRV